MTRLVLPDTPCTPLEFGIARDGSGSCQDRGSGVLHARDVHCLQKLDEGLSRVGADVVRDRDESASGIEIDVRGRGVDGSIAKAVSFSLRGREPHRKWFRRGTLSAARHALRAPVRERRSEGRVRHAGRGAPRAGRVLRRFRRIGDSWIGSGADGRRRFMARLEPLERSRRPDRGTRRLCRERKRHDDSGRAARREPFAGGRRHPHGTS